ncbi:acetyl-CoA hydrolase/transferase family protein [Novosphingobium tardum]|uniref:Acetyl-CoA hydrolase/transferase family protein n=1 Tax=Novosphingobium tardum TaxID=1538021 RepID=A0ABV8RRN4_9SPHN
MSEPRRIAPEALPAALAELLPPGGLALVSSCAAESAILADGVAAAGDALGAMTFTGIFLPGTNRRVWQAGADSRVLTFFLTPELRAAGERVTFLPLCYDDIGRELRRRRPDAALLMCSPPDADGMCSLGVQVDFLPGLWRDIGVLVAHINPEMPRVAGDPGIPFSALTAYVEQAQPLLTAPSGTPDAVAQAIAEHVAPFVPDGSTLQVGIGKIPDALPAALSHRRNLRVHSGLLGDWLLELQASGALAPGPSVLGGIAVGSTALYAALDDPAIAMQPVAVTHGAAALANVERLVTINSAIEVDLFGQAFSELVPKGLMSGPGGATDFARGARSGGGTRIVALPASAGKEGQISRIVLPGAGAGPVSLSRTEIDVVVTEHGAADLRGTDYPTRAARLIALAAPEHREALDAGWRAFAARL